MHSSIATERVLQILLTSRQDKYAHVDFELLCKVCRLFFAGYSMHQIFVAPVCWYLNVANEFGYGISQNLLPD